MPTRTLTRPPAVYHVTPTGRLSDPIVFECELSLVRHAERRTGQHRG
jgi:hypothetical protein